MLCVRLLQYQIKKVESERQYGGFAEEFGKEFEDVSRNLRSVDVGRNPKGAS